MKKLFVAIVVMLTFFISVYSVKAINAEDVARKLKESEDKSKINQQDDTLTITDGAYNLVITIKDDNIKYSASNDTKKDADWIKKVFVAILELKKVDKKAIEEFKKIDLAKEIEDKAKEIELPNSFAGHIKSQYGKDKTLLYHDSKLENGANDNSYRFSGSRSDVTNNYVVFGEPYEYVEVLLGDINLDGEVNANDWGSIMRYVKNGMNATDPQWPKEIYQMLADVDGDGKVTDEDWNAIMYAVTEGCLIRVDKIDGRVVPVFDKTVCPEQYWQYSGIYKTFGTVRIPLTIKGVDKILDWIGTGEGKRNLIIRDAQSRGYVVENNLIKQLNIDISKLYTPIRILPDAYRIIGVFDNQVKLVKDDYAILDLLGTNGAMNSNPYANDSYANYLGKGNLHRVDSYYWNKTNTKWSNSELNKINLNTNYLNRIDFSNLIDNYEWKTNNAVVSNGYTAPSIFSKEINSGNQINKAKIGLMYASDYLYASSDELWKMDAKTGEYATEIANNENWLYKGMNDLTIAESDNNFYGINNTGSMKLDSKTKSGDVRPAFYLKKEVCLEEGSGTLSNPYKLSLGELKYEIDLDINTVINKYVKQDVENPGTGVALPIISIIVLIAGGIGIYTFSKKKNLIDNI